MRVERALWSRPFCAYRDYSAHRGNAQPPAGLKSEQGLSRGIPPSITEVCDRSPFVEARQLVQNEPDRLRVRAGGWQPTGIQQLATGQPFSTNANNNADTSYLHSVFANVTCDPMSGFQRTRFHTSKGACFSQPAAGQYGTARSVRSQRSTFGTNLALMQNFAITERQ